jgi:hypothetical protein
MVKFRLVASKDKFAVYSRRRRPGTFSRDPEAPGISIPDGPIAETGVRSA